MMRGESDVSRLLLIEKFTINNHQKLTFHVEFQNFIELEILTLVDTSV